MYSVLYTICMIALWAVNLLNGTGLGDVYRTTELASMVTMVIAVACLGSQLLKEGDIIVPRRYFFTVVPMAVVFVFISFLNNQKMDGLEGFWVYMIVYILSKTKPSTTTLRMTAACHGALGLALLFVYNYMDALDGWNANSIAMIGLFSFLIFTIPFFGMRDWRSIIMLPLVGAAYVYLILPTDSRSCIIVVIVTLLLVLQVIPVKKLLTSSMGLVLVLIVPLFVAVFVCLFSSFADVSGLMQWSRETFGKELFSGRDRIWLDGFQRMRQNPFFGTGVVMAGYWHNSSIACLTAFGIVGYALWIKLFHEILKEGKPFVDDMCVAGSMVAFLVLSCQQSVELGIFAPNPSLLPYVILGILVGRVNYLRSRQKCLR